MRRLVAFQGVAACVCATTGAFLLWGYGVALLMLAGFLLAGAWSSA